VAEEAGSVISRVDRGEEMKPTASYQSRDDSESDEGVLRWTLICALLVRPVIAAAS
jgi:hypothetical protein